MNKINSKVYYDNQTGEVLVVTGEILAEIEENTLEQDIEQYEALQNRNIDFIKLEYGTLSNTFNNSKTYHIDLKTKKLIVEYFTPEELQNLKNERQEKDSLVDRVFDISDYLYQQSADTIADFENYILQNEINKIMEGVN